MLSFSATKAQRRKVFFVINFCFIFLFFNGKFYFSTEGFALSEAFGLLLPSSVFRLLSSNFKLKSQN